MGLVLILIVLGVLVGLYLIFKLVKKAVYAILLVFLLIVLALGVTLGLVYMDYRYLMNQEQLTFDVVYRDGSANLLGFQIVSSSGGVNLESMKSISGASLSSLNEGSKLGEGEFLVLIDKKTFEKIVPERVEVSSVLPKSFGGISLENINLSFSKSQILEILGSSNESSEFKEKVFAVSLKAALDDKSSFVEIVRAYQDKELIVVPDRFSFKLVRLVPSNIIINKIEQATS